VVDTVGDLIAGMRDMRIRNAILVTALRRIGEPLRVSHADAYDAAAFNVAVSHDAGALIVDLVPAPGSAQNHLDRRTADNKAYAERRAAERRRELA